MKKAGLKTKRILLCLLALVMGMVPACSTGGSGDGSAAAAFDDRGTADLSGYGTMEDYDKDSMLVETTMDEVDRMMKAKESFVLFFSYEECPYCNRLIPYLNDAALDAGVKVGYINTRSNPEWMSNMDIDGYDIVEKRFGKYLDKDEDGRAHLFTPDMYFIKNGKVAGRHEGVTEGADDPERELTSSQEEQLIKELSDGFASLSS